MHSVLSVDLFYFLYFLLNLWTSTTAESAQLMSVHGEMEANFVCFIHLNFRTNLHIRLIPLLGDPDLYIVMNPVTTDFHYHDGNSLEIAKPDTKLKFSSSCTNPTLLWSDLIRLSTNDSIYESIFLDRSTSVGIEDIYLTNDTIQSQVGHPVAVVHAYPAAHSTCQFLLEVFEFPLISPSFTDIEQEANKNSSVDFELASRYEFDYSYPNPEDNELKSKSFDQTPDNQPQTSWFHDFLDFLGPFMTEILHIILEILS